ncbi:hypothetical protein C1H46_022059 [Malus baccata]|uniref:Brix domain-containing protein n=1 Tax=Malus baccata TaxID=106549 RepID=A0A540M0W4_MALBA|nr:hypothetical protein C1H46_022059 [Malus baccata]
MTSISYGAEIANAIMARFKNKKKVFVKSVSMKKQADMDHITGDKIPRSFVFSRCKLPGPLKQLQADLRKLMLPYTTLSLKEKRRNNLRDILNVTRPMGVTHFLMLSKTPTAPYLRDGHGAYFTREGCPVELPENVVPAAYREWEVKVFDWQTQCLTLANQDEHTLLYKNIELLPAVGCEADAATR